MAASRTQPWRVQDHGGHHSRHLDRAPYVREELPRVGQDAVRGVPAFALFFGVLRMRESPRWLSSQDRPPRTPSLERHGKSDRNPVDAVLDDIEKYGAKRLVIGIKRRSPVGKALLGSVSQQLLLESPAPCSR